MGKAGFGFRALLPFWGNQHGSFHSGLRRNRRGLNLWGIRNRSVAEQQFQILGIRSFSGFRDGGFLNFEVHLGKRLIHGAGG